MGEIGVGNGAPRNRRSVRCFYSSDLSEGSAAALKGGTSRGRAFYDARTISRAAADASHTAALRLPPPIFNHSLCHSLVENLSMLRGNGANPPVFLFRFRHLVGQPTYFFVLFWTPRWPTYLLFRSVLDTWLANLPTFSFCFRHLVGQPTYFFVLF